MKKFTNTNWNDLLYSISENEAIVLLGPDVLFDEQNEGVYSKLYKKLATERPEAILDFYEKDGLFLFKQEMDKGVYVREIKKHFKTMEMPEIYSQLMQIPFHVYLKSSPDLLLCNAFEKYKINTSFSISHPCSRTQIWTL